MTAVTARSSPFSIRLEAGLDARITAMAKRLRRSKAAVLQSLADEAERMRRHPGIWFMGDEEHRTPALAGTRSKLYLLIPLLKSMSVERFIEDFGPRVTEAECRAALAYYGEFTAEVDEETAWNSAPVDEVARDYPAAQAITVDD
jgi:uncharacterized protein (DUF433 family)